MSDSFKASVVQAAPPPGLTAARPLAQAASFHRTPSGARLRLVSEPVDGRPRGTVVFVHAFAEEMNKSRHMAARMARLLAADGWRVVQRDLFGCGDSAGDFGDATWAHWEADVAEEAALADADRPLWLWGHRAGALLTAAALRQRPKAHVLWWQPVVSGAQHLQQFARLHAGARIVGSTKAADARSPLQRLRAGETVEVGGYAIHPELARGLEHAMLDLPLGFNGRIVWLDVVAAADAPMPAQAAALHERLRARGIVMQHEPLLGPLFWATQELEDCDALLQRSRAAVAQATAEADATEQMPHAQAPTTEIAR